LKTICSVLIFKNHTTTLDFMPTSKKFEELTAQVLQVLAPLKTRREYRARQGAETITFTEPKAIACCRKGSVLPTWGKETLCSFCTTK